MIKTLYDYLLCNDDIVFDNEDSGNVTFFSDEMGILSIYLNKIKLTLILLVLMKMILKQLFMSVLWLGVTNLNNN